MKSKNIKTGKNKKVKVMKEVTEKMCIRDSNHVGRGLKKKTKKCHR